jgi:glutamate racemase
MGKGERRRHRRRDCSLFQEEGGRRTDAIVLACTHYPLLVDELKRRALAGRVIDPAPAIARRADQLLGERFGADAAGDRQAPAAPISPAASVPGARRNARALRPCVTAVAPTA